MIEGLEGLSQLRELHVEHQTLPAGEQLVFDQRSMDAIAVSCVRGVSSFIHSLVQTAHPGLPSSQRSLNVLSVAGNAMATLRPLTRALSFLTVADVSHNDVVDLSVRLNS